MKNITILLIFVAFFFTATNLLATFNEEIIWDPNGASGEFTSYPSIFDDVISHIDAPADVTVTGGGTNLQTAVNAASSGTLADPYVIEVENGTYTEQVTITDLSNIVIRAADGANPVIDLQSKSGIESAFRLNCTADGNITNIVIKGFEIRNILYFTTPDRRQGIASFNGTRIDNLVIEDNVFDNRSMTSVDHAGLAIVLPEIYGLIIRRNEFYNCGMNTQVGGMDQGTITLNNTPDVNNYIREIFIQNNMIDFDYSSYAATQDTRGIHIRRNAENNDYFENVYLEYNYIANVQKEGIKINSSGLAGNQTAYISNNVIYKVADGIEIDGGNVDIDNCIFSQQCTDGPEAKDLAIDVDGGTVNIRNTVIHEKTDGIDNSATANVICANLFNNPTPHPTNNAGGTVINLDPQFADESNKDYTINNATLAVDGCNSKNYGVYFIPAPTGQPVVITLSVTNIGINSAESGGNVTEDNGFAVTERGIVYNTIGTPTTADDKIIDGDTGLGSFVSNFTGLSPNQVYYVRAYAINSEGTGYGNEVSFATIPTLGEWGLIALGSLVALFGGWVVYRKFV